MSDRNHFLYSRSHYRGQVKPENLVFNANLQEFSQRLNLICGLQTNGKLTPIEAFDQIESLWHQLKFSKKALGIGKDSLQPGS
ncbi:MAG: hypothetical protein HC769_01245 [Cyanobacteria bacterium CRU_2_1]|nr:hypothetical protein [Cyanobacteria bacterium RU_5_0]NJR57592.1 hypothetical protein [Cyanobacteria bacterium CRU_2_1]